MKTGLPTAVVVLGVMLSLNLPVEAAREVFQTPRNGTNLGVWRLTNDPAVRHWANYHNTQCWSPDGRYICYTTWSTPDGQYGDDKVEVHVYDAHRDEDRLIERGFNPRWARHHNWLFYVRIAADRGKDRQQAVEVRWLDLEAGRHTTLAAGVENLGDTSFDDAWLFGAKRFRKQTPEFVTVRIPIREGATPEDLPEAVGSQWMANPRHPVFFTRQDHKSEAFGATRWFYDLDGRHKRMAVPTLQQCHMSWLGNGEFLLLGNGLVRGRRWNEPFPSSVHVLAAVGVGDISPCGRSGRYVCGDSSVADLRSGDGWHFIEPLSIICYPAGVADDSGIYDADPKGSPDGTKICFVSNYDLKDGPLTFIEQEFRQGADVLRVASTQDFPASGALVVRREVIGYQRKTATTFEGLTRKLHDTLPANLRPGLPVTSFEARSLTDEQWRRVRGAAPSMRKTIGDANSPLLRQRQTDVYVAVVRRPDRPCLLASGETVRLIPGEEHFETFGYHLLHNGRRVGGVPLRPGAALDLTKPGEYRAVAVEWSGFESESSLPLVLSAPARLTVLKERPADFSWTHDRWRVGRQPVTEVEAKRSAESTREIVHRHDGVIHREWYRGGVLVQRHDLNAKGKAIRRLNYDQGRLAQREFFQSDGDRVSRELFDAAGNVTESIRFNMVGDKAVESQHWWFDRGMPVRLVDGREEFVKRGDQWVSGKTGKPWQR